MKVLFLDIDGVLNNLEFLKALGDTITFEDMIMPEKVSLLNKIVEEHDFTVVLSTAWRYAFPSSEIERLLRKLGFKHTIHSTTPKSESGQREDDVKMWLEKFHRVKEFVILEDAYDMGTLEPRTVKTDVNVGLTVDHVQQVRELMADG